jgi:hypothetical protein
MGLIAAADGPQQVTHVLVDADNGLIVGRACVAQNGQGPRVVAQGILIGVDAARPVARRCKVAGAARPILAATEVMTQGFQVFQPRRTGAEQTFEDRPGALMQCSPPAQQQVLVDHFVREGAGKAIAMRRT